MRTAGIVVGSLGLAGIVVGSAFGVSAKVKSDEAKKLCPTSPCGDQAGLKSNSEALRDANVSNVSMGIGAGALVVGVILFAVAPSAPKTPPAASAPSPLTGRFRVTSVEPRVSSNGSGLWIGGSF
jgi:hypothetical protein